MDKQHEKRLDELSREEIAQFIFSLSSERECEQHLLSFMKNIANGMLTVSSEEQPDLSEGDDRDIRQKVMSETLPLALHCTKIEEVLKSIVMLYNHVGELSTILKEMCEFMGFDIDTVLNMFKKSVQKDMNFQKMLKNYNDYEDIDFEKGVKAVQENENKEIDTSTKVVDAAEVFGE